jgi:uncharacterized iron-regulated protein
MALCTLLVAGCASTGASRDEEVIRDARLRRDVSFETMVDDLATVPMVFIGELHTHPGHHEVQQRVLEGLHRRGVPLLLGMEMFERPYQPVLDRWTAGELSEEQFLREVSWYESWGFDWSLYRPILLFARDHHIPVVALNAERAIIREIGRGGLDAVPPWMRVRIPEELPVPDSGRHHESIFGIWRGHMPADMVVDRAAFRRFYEAQCTWDETMAESAAVALAGDRRRGTSIVVLAGAMHIEGFECIPERARRRNGLDYRTVLPLTARPPGESAETPSVDGPGRDADYLVPTGPVPETSRFLGVLLRGGDNLVTAVPEGSPAFLAGLMPGDRLVALGDTTITDGFDLKRALDGHSPGDKFTVRWLRDGVSGSGEATLAPPPPPVFR